MIPSATSSLLQLPNELLVIILSPLLSDYVDILILHPPFIQPWNALQTLSLTSSKIKDVVAFIWDLSVGSNWK